MAVVQSLGPTFDLLCMVNRKFQKAQTVGDMSGEFDANRPLFITEARTTTLLFQHQEMS